MKIMLPIFARVPKNPETGTKVGMLTPKKVLGSQSQKMRVKEKEIWKKEKKQERERKTKRCGAGKKGNSFNSMSIIVMAEYSVSQGIFREPPETSALQNGLSRSEKGDQLLAPISQGVCTPWNVDSSTSQDCLS